MSKANDKNRRRPKIKAIRPHDGASRTAGSKNADDRKLPRSKAGPIPRLKVRKNATPSEIYATYRKQFTAADLQTYTEIEPMVPADQLLTELEAIDREETGKRKKKP